MPYIQMSWRRLGRERATRVAATLVVAVVFAGSCGDPDTVPEDATSTSTSAFGASTTSTSAGPKECEDIVFTPQSEDGAREITATNVGCDAANELVATVRDEHDFVGGPRSFRSGGYECTVVTHDTALPYATYTCTSGEAKVTWDKS